MATNQQRREAAKRKLDRQIERRAERQKRQRRVWAGVTIVAVLLVGGGVVWVVSANKGGDDAAAQPTPTSATPTEIQIPTQRAPMPKRPKALANPVTCDFVADTKSPAPKKVNLPDGKNVSSTGTVNVTLKSTQGDIGLVLDRALAPCAVQSFLSLANQGFYTDTMCHRLGTEGLQMLQCGDPSAKGDPNADGQGGPGYTMPDENFPELTYGRGILAMAKTQAPNSGGSQFFVVYGDAQLSPDYSVFGSITDEGLKVLDKVARGGIGTPGQDGTGAPTLQVKFTGVTVG